MDTIFMNSENSKISEPHRLLLNLTDEIDLRRKNKYITLSNLSIYFTWKNIKNFYKSNKFKIIKGCGFLSFAKNMGRNISKNISKNLSSKCSQKLLDHTKQSATGALKTALKRAIQKTAHAIGDLIHNKIADSIMKISKISSKNNSERNEKGKLRKRFTLPELRHKIINDLKLKEKNY